MIYRKYLQSVFCIALVLTVLTGCGKNTGQTSRSTEKKEIDIPIILTVDPTSGKKTEQDVVEIPQKDASEVENWHEALCELCSKLNLSRPVILDKHVNELLRFSHTVFRPDDFMEQVTFDRLEVELF